MGHCKLSVRGRKEGESHHSVQAERRRFRPHPRPHPHTHPHARPATVSPLLHAISTTTARRGPCRAKRETGQKGVSRRTGIFSRQGRRRAATGQPESSQSPQWGQSGVQKLARLQDVMLLCWHSMTTSTSTCNQSEEGLDSPATAYRRKRRSWAPATPGQRGWQGVAIVTSLAGSSKLDAEEIKGTKGQGRTRGLKRLTQLAEAGQSRGRGGCRGKDGAVELLEGQLGD